jgi:arsenite-transporting ATPase
VGKTTCAAVHALDAARRGHRVLVVSTDPAHSLGDALGVRLSSRPTSIGAGARRHLFGVEIDAAKALSRWLRDHRQALGDVIEHGTWLDRHDVEALLELPIPGIDELLGMLEIVRLSAAGQFTRVVVDTAPTGHALRLLAAPATVSAVSNVLDLLQETHRIIRRRFARIDRPEAADRLIALLAGQAAVTGGLLRDPRRAAFSWVLLPEALSLAESRDGLAALRAARIAVTGLIVNRVIRPSVPGQRCAVCDPRRRAEHDVLTRLSKGIGKGRQVTVVAEELREPQGLIALARMARVAFPSARPLASGPARRTSMRPERVSRTIVTSGTRAGGPSLLDAIAGARLILAGGKGGVGKTTVAATLALALARRLPTVPVLLLSTDPAHSLGDVLATAVDDEPRAIESGLPNLAVRELDAGRALALRRVAIEAALQDILVAIGSRTAGERGISELMDLAPPGIDELFGLLSVVEAREQYRHIVLDMAPTGHALRLLEMPAAARAWVQLLLRVLLKYRGVVRPGRLAAELVELSKAVRRLHDQLRDPGHTRFVAVTRAAEVPRRETVRLMSRLRRLGITVSVLIVNARTLAPGACPRCRSIDRLERRELAALAPPGRARGECAIIQTPLAVPPPRGVAALDRWARTWM